MSTRPHESFAPISYFRPPYVAAVPIEMTRLGSVDAWRGSALLWRLTDGSAQQREFEWLSDRPHGLPLVIMLPRPEHVSRALPLLTYIRALEPKAVIPDSALGVPLHLKRILYTTPTNVSATIMGYLTRRGLFPDRGVYGEIQKIIELSEDVRSISSLARRLYTSRRTLGRHFAAAGMPVPSHWLQFARLFRACLLLQSESATVFSVAHKMKYPDGFTLSNQMKRMIGVRPSQVRGLGGWEWIIESWLKCENVSRSG